MSIWKRLTDCLFEPLPEDEQTKPATFRHEPGINEGETAEPLDEPPVNTPPAAFLSFFDEETTWQDYLEKGQQAVDDGRHLDAETYLKPVISVLETTGTFPLPLRRAWQLLGRT